MTPPIALKATTEGGGALDGVWIVLALAKCEAFCDELWVVWLVNNPWVKLVRAFTMSWKILVECSCMS